MPVLALRAIRFRLGAILSIVLLAGCGDGEPVPAPAVAAADPHAGHDHGSSIHLSEAAQRNLGVTWATAEYRVVASVLRMPGRFEAEATARRPYAAPLDGRIEVAVRPYDRVEAGAVLYRLHAPGWSRLQQELADARAAVQAAADDFAAAESRAAAIARALAVWEGHQQALDQLGSERGGLAVDRAEAAGRVADLRINAAEAASLLAAAERRARGGEAQLRVDLLLAQAVQLTGLSTEALLRTESGRPAWAGIDALAVRAVGPGVVEGGTQASGTWVDARAVVLTVTDPREVRLRAAGLQADLPRLRDGLRARIVAADPAEVLSLPASLVIGPMADAIDRSVDLIARPQAGVALPAWVRPGVTANLEVVIDGGAAEELAIPVAATIRDGLDTIFFRRDPRNPEQVARVVADLGVGDGRWVSVMSGLKEGDQVVLGGIYPLRLLQQSGGAQAGHYDPDGTFHTGKH